MSERSQVCSMCGKDVKNLSHHMRNVHTEKEVPFEVCNKVFKSVMLKVNHVNNTHGLPTSCLLCEITFPSNAYLRTHIRKVHKKENKYSCNYCDKKFTSKQVLKLHDLKSCPNKFNKTVKCKYCDKPFQGKAALISHIQVHEIKTSVSTKIKCHICPMEILEKNLQNHLNTHSKKVHKDIGFGSFEKSSNKITCDKCELLFSNTFSLKRHMRTIHNVNSGSVGSKNGKNKNKYSCGY